MNATAQMINSGRRLHLQHGPIDLVIEAWGQPEAVAQAYQQAQVRFETVLSELVVELELLRSPLNRGVCNFSGAIARHMWRSVSRAATPAFSTPMIAVAGSVADEVLQAMSDGVSLQRAYVNNGGDIALSLGDNSVFNVGVVTDLQNKVAAHNLPTSVTIKAGDGVGGTATSGRHGRSLSLGIADAVTVLAENAAVADAAATLIANEVNIARCPNIIRRPANDIDPDSDLGSRLVTVHVLPLTSQQTDTALDNGLALANSFVSKRVISGAWLSLNNNTRTTSRDCAGKLTRFENQLRDYNYA